jgi:hypothetical protein
MSDAREDVPASPAPRILSFSQGNPVGPGYWDVPGLLRRVADSIEGIPNVRVNDIVFHSVETSESEDMHMTVYYRVADREERERDRFLDRIHPGDEDDEG